MYPGPIWPWSDLRIDAAAQHVAGLDALFAATVASVNSAATQRGQR